MIILQPVLRYDRTDRSVMSSMITIFYNSGFQLSARLSNVRCITIITRYLINHIALRYMGINILLYFNIFTHFIRTMKRYPDVVSIEPLNFSVWKGINGTVSQDADLFAQTLSTKSLCPMCLFLSKFFIRWLTVKNKN